MHPATLLIVMHDEHKDMHCSYFSSFPFLLPPRSLPVLLAAMSPTLRPAGVLLLTVEGWLVSGDYHHHEDAPQAEREREGGESERKRAKGGGEGKGGMEKEEAKKKEERETMKGLPGASASL